MGLLADRLFNGCRLSAAGGLLLGWLWPGHRDRLAVGLRRLRRAGQESALVQNLARDLFHQRRILPQVLLGVFPPLAKADLSVTDPGSALFDDLVFDAQVQQVAFAADAVVVHQVELSVL